MKILLLITDLQIGGTPTVVRELAIRLSQSNSVMVACLSREGPVAEQLREAGVSVIAFNANRASQLIRVTRQLVSLIRRERFDTVCSFLIHANVVAAIAARFCPGVRFLQSIQTTQPTPRWHWWMQSLVQHSAEKIFVPSPSVADVAKRWADIPAEKIVLIPNAVDVPASVLPRASSGRAIGFIGRFDPIKRIPDLLAAVGLLDSRYELHLFGDGKERLRIEAEIARQHLEGRVKLHGLIAKPQAALALIDVLVLPSGAEGFGLVLIEAMAAGVPVVATDVSGIQDVASDGKNGLLVPVASPAALAEAIRFVCEDVSLRERLIQTAIADVRARFSWEVVLPQYKSLLGLAP